MKSLIVYGLIILAGYLFYTFTQADRDDTGVIVSEGNIDAFSIRVGDCFDDEGEEDPGVDEDLYVEIQGVSGIPCSEPHDNEVFALVDMSFDEFPGADAIADAGFSACLEHFDSYVAAAYEDSALDVFTLHPTAESWAQDDREVVCVLYDLSLAKLNGSVRGSGL